MSTTTTSTSVPPDSNNPVLYIQNLPEKLPKPTLRRALYTFFAPHGPVLAITACKTRRMRGQAHILFRDVACATIALRACHGQEFLGRTMRVGWSKNRSKVLAVMRGGDAVEIQGSLPPSQPTGGSTQPAPAPATTGGGLLPPPPGMRLPAKVEGGASPSGVKRGREESDGEGEQGDVPMEEEEEEDDGAMDMSDDDD